MKRILFLLLILLVKPINLNAQSDLIKRLNDIKGNVNEIIIKSEGKEYTFSGDEAEKLFANLKSDKGMKHFEFYTDDGRIIKNDSLKKKIFVKKLDNDSEGKEVDVLIFTNEVDDTNKSILKTIEKNVIISEDEGKKIVKVIINEDGKESIEVYEGSAADKYLDKMKSEKEFNEKKDLKNKKIQKIIIDKQD